MTLVESSGGQVPTEEQRNMLGDRLKQVSEVLSRHKVRLGLESTLYVTRKAGVA